VGTQEPPARRFARLLAVAAQRAGPSCALPGQVAPSEPRGNITYPGVQFSMAERVRFRTSVDTVRCRNSWAGVDANAPEAVETEPSVSLHRIVPFRHY
jgi:hypothetical protein